MAFDKKTVYHSALVHEGPVEVTITSDVIKSKFQKNGQDQFYVEFTQGKSSHQYICENDMCVDALDGKKGKRVELEATGSREDAEIRVTVLGSGTTGGNGSRSERSERNERGYQQPQGRQGSSEGRRQQNGQEREPVFGATVGMAINQACDMIREAEPDYPITMEWLLSPDFSQNVHTIASDLIRVSRMLEKGILAPSAKERAAEIERQQEEGRKAQLEAQERQKKQSEQQAEEEDVESEIPF